MTTADNSTGHTKRAAWRISLGHFVETNLFKRTFLTLIVINSISLGLSTSKTVQFYVHDQLILMDRIVIGLFVIEFFLRILAFGKDFFRNWWNLFDISVVSFSMLPSSGFLSVLRALRIIRAMRILTVLPQMRQVIQALLDALPGMISIMIVLAVIYYIFAVMATGLFGNRFPDWFGDIGRSLYSLFQIMTLESWSMGIVRPVMEVYPYAWALFIPFIILTAFAVLNVFIGLVVNTMQGAYEEERSNEVERLRLTVLEENRAVSTQMHEFRQTLFEILERIDTPSRSEGDDNGRR